jgi:carbonic anhydrase
MRPVHTASPLSRITPLAFALLLAALPAAAQEERIGVAKEECVVGDRQSPIVLAAPFQRDTATLAVDYPIVRGAYAFNTGQTVQVNIPDAVPAWVQVSGRRFRLLQFHFHHPVEHRLAGGVAPGRVEVHLVHSDGQGEAVIGTFVRVGERSRAWTPVLGSLPAPGDTVRNLPPLDLNAMFSLWDLNREPLFRYDGSLTTPAYCQGVRWLVRQRTVSWSQAQVAALLQATPQLRRLPMPRHGRPI